MTEHEIDVGFGAPEGAVPLRASERRPSPLPRVPNGGVATARGFTAAGVHAGNWGV